jgi:hypothetical protein
MDLDTNKQTKMPVAIMRCVLYVWADRVFGPATTTRGVYDAAAQQVVSGVMEGINGKGLVSPLKMVMGCKDLLHACNYTYEP